MNVKFTKNERERICRLVTRPEEFKSIVYDPVVRAIIHKLKLWSEEDDEDLS